MARIVITVSTTVLSNDKSLPDHDVLTNLAVDIAAVHTSGHEVLLVTSGAVLWGRELSNLEQEFSVEVLRSGRRGEQRETIRRQVLASIGQPKLMVSYIDALNKHGVSAAQLFVTRHDLAEQRHYENLFLVTTSLLKHRILPLFNGHDPLSSDEIGHSDYDQLGAMLATAFAADKLIILTAADRQPLGTGDSYPGSVIESIDELDSITSGVPDGSIQLPTKANVEAARLVTAFGVDVVIADGKSLGVLTRILLDGKVEGTVIRARGQKLRLRKGWIALTSQSKGDIVVSSFLADRLSQRKAGSILLIGVEQAVGNFRPNDVVTVRDMDGHVLGRGEVRLSSDDLRREIEGRERGRKVEFFGTEVIHCDYFVPAPA